MATSALAAFFAVIVIGFVMGLGLYGLVILSRRWKAAMKERVLNALKRRRKTTDTFRQDNGYSWDYMMVFRVYDEEDPISELQCKYNMKFVLNKLLSGGLEFHLFYSLKHKEVFCKIRAAVSRLQKHADLVDFKLLLDQEALRSLCAKGREVWREMNCAADFFERHDTELHCKGKWGPLKIPLDTDLTSLDPYEYIYAKYEFDAETGATDPDLAPLYKRWPIIEISEETERKITFDKPVEINNPLAALAAMTTSSVDAENAQVGREAHMFRGVDRLKLIHMIVSYGGPGGCGLDPAQMLKDECLLAYSPLHDSVDLRFLESRWLTLLAAPWKQPTDMVKDYFGEKIGLYFVWLGHYTTWLVPASIVGFFVWINVAADDNNPNAVLIPYFAGFMGLWSAMFLENWKRKEKTTAMRWGMVGYEDEEQDRPQFQGQPILSPVTGKPALYFSRQERSKRSFQSRWVIIGMIWIVIVVISCIFILRVVIAKSSVAAAGVISSLLIALQIQILNGYFGEVAIKLNNRENHRTDTEYEDALIAKTFAFQFVNSFASLFYIAFVKPFLQQFDACVGSCMLELQTTLGTIFITRLAVGNLTELGIPLVNSYLNVRARNQQAAGDASSTDAKLEMSEVERTFAMPVYDVMLGTFDDYAEMIIQFGYTTMFVAGFPLAPLMSLVNNYVEIRVDAWKLCQLCRRPEPRSCEDIGTWYSILEIISMASIFINSAIVAFTASNTLNYRWAVRVWIFILMSAGLFSIRMTVAWLIPDEPAEVIIQLDRQKYITDKVLNDVEDEDDSGLSKGLYISPNYLVKITDDDPM